MKVDKEIDNEWKLRDPDSDDDPNTVKPLSYKKV
jgi:hypothetical protein